MTHSDESSIVYLVDDDEAVRRGLSRLLRSAGLETREFESGDAFMHAGVDSRRACVVAESSMPGGDGVDLPRRLRECGRDTPVILLTSEPDGKCREAARAAGALFFCINRLMVRH